MDSKNVLWAWIQLMVHLPKKSVQSSTTTSQCWLLNRLLVRHAHFGFWSLMSLAYMDQVAASL